MTNTIQQLHQLGQSIWYDNIERRLINNGELKKLIESGISGVTTNPSIFEKAVSSSRDYDHQLIRLTQSGKKPREVYDELTVQDVSAGANLLNDVFKSSNRQDGYISIEVWPEYSRNAAKTIDYARRIFKKISKGNIMIKVPGTKEAPEAISTLISEGINVNVTLLFSDEHYQTIARAYIDGLKTRLEKGGDLSQVNSVASVFVSRIDSKIDKLLDELAKQKPEQKDAADALKGKVAVAYMKSIHQSYKKIFSQENFGDLLSNKAHVQRILWASTSTKSPAYRDVLYVEELIGPQTINTVPPKTLDAFLDHGKVAVTIDQDLDQARSILTSFKSLGFDISRICQEIQDAGVKSFQDAFDKLIQSIKNKSC
ncbi:MAG: transaldolase [Planctomycetes bacterium]|nr:transaldolase [Planctomycetota bacterium]